MTEVGEINKAPVSHEEPDVLRSLLQIGVNLTQVDDVPTMLDMILGEIRKLAQAEAGSLYIRKKGGNLRLAVVPQVGTPHFTGPDTNSRH